MKGTDKVRPFIQWGFVLFFILFVGLRYQTGPDYNSYKDIFSDWNRWSEMEPFFQIVLRVFNWMSVPYFLFLLFIAALSIGIKGYAIKKYSPYFFLSAVIALPVTFLGDMGQIRFSLAIPVLWLSITYCLERDLKKYLIVMLIAFTMHYSSLVFLPVYWLSEKKISLYVIFGVWGLCYLLSFTRFENWFASSVFDIGISEFSQKTELYAEDETGGGRYGVSMFGLLSKILVVVILYYFSEQENESGLLRMMLNVYFFGGCFFFLFSFNEIFGTRFSLYFLSFEALAIPAAIYKVKDIKLHYVFLVLFIGKAFYQYYTVIYASYQSMFLPYKNVLQFYI